MTKEDVEGVHLLLQTNFSKFHLSPILSVQEVEHWLLPCENVIDTYVVKVWLNSFVNYSISFFLEGTKLISLNF